MEHVLQRIMRSRILSILYGFLGYNQVLVNEYDQHKKIFNFTTPWGTIEYLRIPFGLLNLGAKF